MSSTAAPVPPSFDKTFGVLFLASVLTTALWGACGVQLYFYYDTFSKTDRWWLKIYVFIVYALDTMHQTFILASVYLYFVSGFSDVSNLNHIERPLVYIDIGAGFTDVPVQILFVMRIWRLGKKNYILTGVPAILVTAQFVLVLYLFGMIYGKTEITELVTCFKFMRGLNAVIFIADTTIACVMIYLLHSVRSGIKQTDSLLNRLIIYTISTGLTTSILALVSVVVPLDTFINLACDLIIPKLYTNSMLALLNSRQKLRDTISDSFGCGISINNNIRMHAVDANAARNDVFGTDIVIDIIKVDNERMSVSASGGSGRSEAEEDVKHSHATSA
ncbi:hypothetical protein EW145_g5903 [Phellinidium pouzarii]|uniref:DUF6534 domain-containing protein n=1 Tax=Phellinidium pouzarii TaxID=167371 RepID=A0A4S4KZM2_9AGAM|nr:hypothetical protein EW145_g5903 [Phellinidium pouzarii]